MSNSGNRPLADRSTAELKLMLRALLERCEAQFETFQVLDAEIRDREVDEIDEDVRDEDEKS